MALVAIFAALVSLTSIGAFLGGQWPFLDLVASFRPHLTVAAIVAALVLFGGRWHRWAAATGVIGLVNLAVVVPLFISPSAPPEGDILRIMSFNLLSDNDRYEEVIDFIALESPDVVILHEVSRPWEEALAGAGLDYEITRGRTEGLIFGSLVMAPIDSTVQSFGFAISNPRAIEVILPSGVAVLGIHPLAPFPDAQTDRRRFQFEFAALWTLAQSGPRVVAGDFNAGPWSYSFRRLVNSTGLHNSQRGFGLELSYPADSNPVFQVSIDHLLHSSDLAVADRKLGPAMGSDHLPLIVDLIRVETP
ncbi:MAG TPA: endonuclease/exonuclease/phosphatase family protein [Acidimicrobiia bacterium]|nr:endonuclease/exonuclease/phosphatase family protein [Acidimicrobiia bacterium]